MAVFLCTVRDWTSSPQKQYSLYCVGVTITAISLVGAATIMIFVATKVLSCPKFCHNKCIFVITKHIFCRNKNTLVTTKLWSQQQTNICRNKHNFVTTKLWSQQAYFCRDKHAWFSEKRIMFFVTTFIMTKMILVKAPANDSAKAYDSSLQCQSISWPHWLQEWQSSPSQTLNKSPPPPPPEAVQSLLSPSLGIFILRVSSTLHLSSRWSVLWRPWFCAPVKSLLPLNILDLSRCKQLEPAAMAVLPTHQEHYLLYCLPCMCRTVFILRLV